MRIVVTETKVYKFEELTKEQQQKAIDNLYDINIDHDWWDFVYEDAKTIGCEIRGFDIDRGSFCELKMNYPESTARNILENHGKNCDTFKLAEEFLKDCERNGHHLLGQFEDWEDIEREFKRAIAEEYLSMLRREYEYLTSEEAIKETIECNEYEFTEEGKIY
jgi:hypothetical protein